ncbi:hypothetical protein H0I23_01195 [Cellulophaga sp. HaHaR_3_176]|uniref:DUF6702 family protein n=1 Tax=Cellulophaga sp. HaHaR_3_176 TaxID=1942464 RepID=UPI001C1FC915|nr:DUF6702 family protein [Cellulophaga sp. HaHaR_3_176]QWX84298.1 hypothetical protein H0I23_01195 [Cellulophaga sp. HaHaR_3_176]
MKTLKKSLLLLVLPLIAFTAAHKFYVSVTNVMYSDKDEAIQITTRIFIDDLEKALEERYEVSTKMATKKEIEDVDYYVEKYLKSKFLVFLDGTQKEYTYIGKKYDNDVIVCYIEVANVKMATLKSIAIINEVLTGMFDEQQNVVHFKLNNEKKSYVLGRENNKGMLNF